jgi:polyhydroxybutyrate depolymerase
MLAQLRERALAADNPYPTIFLKRFATMLNAILLIAMSALLSKPLTVGDQTRTITVGKLERTYLVHVPAKYDRNRPAPIVLVFHGGASNAERMVRFCGLNEKADEAGFLAVYPSGSGRLPGALTWNGGNCCGYAAAQNIDDVAFVRAVLDDLTASAKIDAKRVYATGMSNGAIFSYRLADELSDRIAAIAPVSGTMGSETCHPTRPLPVIHFHGTADEFVSFGGGAGSKSLSKTNFFSVEHTIRQWVKADGCAEEPTVAKLPDKAHDGTIVTRKTFGPGKEGAEVVLYVIEGGGHTWPGRTPRIELLGKSTKNISANDLIWEFFEKHPMK